MTVMAHSLLNHVDAGRVSRDRLPAKKHGQTTPRTSSESLPANKNGRTVSRDCGGSQPCNDGGGSISGTQETHARPPLVRESLVCEPQAADDMPGLLPPILQTGKIVTGK